MTTRTLEAQLAAAPPAVRRMMLEDRNQLAPGAAAVVGRLFASVQRHRASASMPSAQCFREAARSESTFRCLLRALARHAPHVCTAEAVVVSDEWYARRKKPAAARSIPVRQRGRTWPAPWRRHLKSLERADIEESTRRRYVAHVDRCANLVAEGWGTETFGFMTAVSLEEGLLSHPDEARRVKIVTAANYLDGLIALGRFGGENPDSLEAMRLVSKDLRDRADLDGKNKEERISKLMDRGGFDYIVDRIALSVERWRQLPVHSAAGRRFLQSAALCLVLINKPPRRGDIVRWRFGHELVRDPDGGWRATWEQEKTGHETESGVLWPEVCELLDLWILGGRPDRLVAHRYRELVGLHWLTLTGGPAYRNLPSELTRALAGVPSHDLRTLAADYMRRHDPVRAANVIATHLGHANERAGRDYASQCGGVAGQRLWQDARAAIASADGHGRTAAKAEKHKRARLTGTGPSNLGRGRSRRPPHRKPPGRSRASL